MAVVARGRTWFFDDLGDGDNGDAEWLALIAALRVAHELGADAFELIGDNAGVIRQANGVWPCRDGRLAAHRARFEVLAEMGRPARVRWIRRAQNLAGIALEKRRGRAF